MDNMQHKFDSSMVESKQLKRLVMKCLNRNSDDRPSMNELQKELTKFS